MNFLALKQKVADYLNRTDLTAQIPDFVITAQRDLERGQFILDSKMTLVNWNCMKQRKTVSSSEVYLTLPERIKEVRWVKILLNDRYYSLTKKDPDVSLSMWPYPTVGDVQSRPEVYAFLEEQNELLLRPTPDQSYTYDMGFYAYTADLAADGNTNWWTTNAWEILLYGALVRAEPYLMNDPRLEVWKKFYEEAVAKLAKAEKAGRAGGERLVIESYLPVQLRAGYRFDFNTGDFE
jgi:hypothetical protein